jgi:catecholate siderophore receptor
MSSARVPGSLRRPLQAAVTEGTRRGQPRVDVNAAKLMTAACLLAASPASQAVAQGSSSTSLLPPLSVEANAAQQRASAISQPSTGGSVVPVPEPTPEQKAQSPYVDPVAPYKVQESGSGKITEPLAETPKTITAISKEVIDDKAATSVREIGASNAGRHVRLCRGRQCLRRFTLYPGQRFSGAR